MGCCQSRESDDPAHSEPAVRGHGNDSAVGAQGQAAGDPSDPAALHIPFPQPEPDAGSNRRRIRSNPHCVVLPHHVPLGEHYNQAVRPHVWKSKRRTWDRIQLAREREEFFDTRVTGRQEVWAALSAATTLLREGDVTTAQSIIDAAGVTVPSGNLCEGCYDENGVFYRLPEPIVADPQNVVEPPVEEESKYHPSGCLADDEVSSSKPPADFESDEEMLVDRGGADEKGKLKKRELIKVRTRLSDREGPDLTVTIGKEQTVGVLARKVQHEAGLVERCRVRIAYLGKILNEHDTLLSQGWKTGRVVNGLVANEPSN